MPAANSRIYSSHALADRKGRYVLYWMQQAQRIRYNPAISHAIELANVPALAEELIIRRELSMNYCHYNPGYDTYQAIPLWARTSLAEHEGDPRERIYPLDKLENAETDDVCWNAAQIEMMTTGKMHNYTRMYWGKRLISWCASPEEAFYNALYLNNKYHLDGRNANAYAGVAWCFGKHDRPWAQRPVYGSVRYMNANGLNRKFDMQAYLNKVAAKEF